MAGGPVPRLAWRLLNRLRVKPFQTATDQTNKATAPTDSKMIVSVTNEAPDDSRKPNKPTLMLMMSPPRVEIMKPTPKSPASGRGHASRSAANKKPPTASAKNSGPTVGMSWYPSVHSCRWMAATQMSRATHTRRSTRAARNESPCWDLVTWRRNDAIGSEVTVAIAWPSIVVGVMVAPIVLGNTVDKGRRWSRRRGRCRWWRRWRGGGGGLWGVAGGGVGGGGGGAARWSAGLSSAVWWWWLWCFGPQGWS